MFELCEYKDREGLLCDLVKLIKDCGNKISTGFLGTPYILHVLSNGGYGKLAYDLLLSEETNSWLYSVKKGATTIWEHYDGIKEDGSFWSKEMNSFNHYAYGSVFNWVFQNSIGIRLVKPGYKEVIIEPIFDKRLGFVKSSFETKYGKICVNYELDKTNVFHYEIQIPKGIKALVKLENGFNKLIKNGDTLKGEYVYETV